MNLRRLRNGRKMANKNNHNNSEAQQQEDQPRRRSSKSGGGLAEQLVCPITHQLPVEPVIAQDGQVYERNAIELYFQLHEEDTPDAPLLSPSTQKPLAGKHLSPAGRYANTLEILIDKGLMKGELAQTWKKQQAAKTRAMETVRNLLLGRADKVSPQDEQFAKDWYGKDPLQGVNVAEVATLGALILYSGNHQEDKKQNQIEGMSYVLWANKRGSILSAYVLGMGIANGKHGLKQNSAKAQHWLEKVVAANERQPQEDDSTDPLDSIPDPFYLDYLPFAQAKLKDLKRTEKLHKNKKGSGSSNSSSGRSVHFLLPVPEEEEHSC